MNEQEIADKGPLYCQDLYNQWRMLDFRGIMHINMDSRINIPLQEIFVVPDVVHLVPEFETLEREETPRTPGIKPNLRHDHTQHDKSRSKEGRESFLQVLATSTSRSLVILGDPGAGKTTLLRYLLLQLTEVEHKSPTKLQAISKLKNFLPLYIPLAAFASAYYTHGICTLEDFLPFLLKDYALDNYIDLLQAKIKHKQVCFLLDGLDELANTGLRRTVVDELMRFTRVHAENYFLVTSRIVGYKDIPLNLPYQPYTIVDFSKEQIREFTQNWYPAYEYWVNASEEDSIYLRKRAQEEAKHLFKAIQHDQGVQRLAVNPLLLTILALIQRQGIDLPAHRVELFDLCVNTLIDTWLRAKGYLESSRLNKNDLFKLLRPLAFWMHAKRDGNTISKESLREQMRKLIKARNPMANEQQIEQMIQSFIDTVHGKTGILVERGDKQYGFLHQSFQEYFAARELVVHKHRERLIRQHLHNPHWREVILLAAGIIGILQCDEERVTELVQEVMLKARSKYERWLHRDLLLTGSCLADDIGVSSSCEYLILSETMCLYLTSPFSSLRSKCAEVFSKWQGTEIAQEAQKLIVPFLSKQVLLAGNDEQEDIVLAERTPFEHRVLAHYQGLIQQHKHALEQIVRLQIQVILYRLGQIQVSDIHIDEQALRNEASWQVRKLAVFLLTEPGSQRSDLIKALLTALRDPHAEVRRTAAKGLKERGEARDDILNALCSAQYDPDPAVRTAAKEALDHLNREQEDDVAREEIEEAGLDRETRALLKYSAQYKKQLASDEWLALDNPRARKRRQAIIRLASAHVKEQQVLNLLRDIAYHKTGEDPSNIKQAVVTILQRLQYVAPDGAPQAIEILLNLAADPNPYVREIAIIILGQLDDTGSRLSETLQALMKSDPDPFVREAATIILGYASDVEAQNRRQDQAENSEQKSLEALLPKLANLEADSTKATMESIEKLGRDHPDVKLRLVEVVSNDRVIKELVSKPIEIYRQQIYIEALIRNLQILKYFGSDQPQVLKILFANLTSQNEEIRYMTIEALSRLGASNAEVVNKLINILSDPAEMIRNEAVNVLGELGKAHHNVLKAMVEALQTNPLVDRCAIAEALRKSGSSQPFVIEALLALLGHSTSASEMLEAMLTSHPADRQAVVEALAQLGAGNDRVLGELLSTLQDRDLTVRTAAVSALARLGKGNKTVCQALVKALRDKSPSVRQAAASALGQVGYENCGIVDELLRACKDRDLHVRKAAFPALIQIGREQQHVRNVLENDFLGSALTKRELALAFAQLQQVEPVFMPMLLHALQDKDPSIQGHIALALGKINGNQQQRQHVSRALIETLSRATSSTLRSDILLALGKISSHDAVNPRAYRVLMDALNDPDDAVKYNAAFALAQQDHYPPEVVSVLLYALLDTEALIRQEAITLLSHIADKHPNVVEALLRSLADADQSVREAAASALARSDDSKDRSIIGERLTQLLDSYKNIVDKQLTADAAIEATLSSLQRVTGGT